MRDPSRYGLPGLSPSSPEEERFLDPPSGDLPNSAEVSIGDADGLENLHVSPDEGEKFENNLPENTEQRRYPPYQLGDNEQPRRKPKKTHTVFDSQMDELILEHPQSNTIESWPYAVAATRWETEIQRLDQECMEDQQALDGAMNQALANPEGASDFYDQPYSKNPKVGGVWQNLSDEDRQEIITRDYTEMRELLSMYCERKKSELEDSLAREQLSYAVRLSSAPRLLSILPRFAILRSLAQMGEDPEILSLIQRFKQGDQAAGDELYRRYERLIEEIIQRRVYRLSEATFNLEDVEDIRGDAAVAFVNAILRYDGRAKLSTYLWVSVDGAVLNSIRDIIQERSRTVPVPQAEQEQIALPQERELADIAERSLLRRLREEVDLNKLFERMPRSLRRHRDWFDMRFNQGMSWEEIGEQANRVRQQVHDTVRRMLDWLRKQPEIQRVAR